MFKQMIESVKTKVRQKRQKKRLKAALSDPRTRLEMMRAGYKKFSAQLTERERAKLKKEIKLMERQVRDWERKNV